MKENRASPLTSKSYQGSPLVTGRLPAGGLYLMWKGLTSFQ